ncbi:MAG: hypothetical protein MI919_16185 [Holophagales bacterium]|nr:hypothetical protein [Holophagales bacterium]
MAEESAVILAPSDELGPIESLEIGRSLFVRATGLGAGEAVSFVLLDEAGWQVAEAVAITDGSGQTEEVRVWVHTGLVGCDCGSEVGSYRYARVEDAIQALEGRTFSLALVDGDGAELAALPLDLVAPARPLAFPADETGCPRFFLRSWEDLFLAVFGGSAESQCEARVYLGTSDPGTTPGDSPLESSVLWQGGGPSPEVLLLRRADDRDPSELTIWFSCARLPGINSGVIIEDHSCPPPPPPPSPNVH